VRFRRGWATFRALGKHPGRVPGSHMTSCAGRTPIFSDLYRRGRPDSSKCNGPIDACGGQVGKSSSVTVTSGDIPGPRQASRAVPPSHMTRRTGRTPICSDLYRRGRPDSSNYNGQFDARGGTKVGRSGGVSSGGPAGRRQASRGGATVSHDRRSLSDARLHRSVASVSS